MKRIAAFQLGNCYVSRHPGYQVLSRVYDNPACLWLTPVGEGANRHPVVKRLEGFIREAGPAELALGLPTGTYRVRLTAYERTLDHGPFDVQANGVTVLSQALAPAGRIRQWSFRCQARRNRLSLVFTPAPGKDFLLNTIELFADAPVRWRPLFRTAPSHERPARAELRR